MDTAYYADWGDPREFTLNDLGTGECAGEVISPAEFTLAASEREVFKRSCPSIAAIRKPPRRGASSRCSVLRADWCRRRTRRSARTRVKLPLNSPAAITTPNSFGTSTRVENSPEYFFSAKEVLKDGKAADADRAVQLVQEAQLLIDAAHDCYNKLGPAVQSAIKILVSAEPVV